MEVYAELLTRDANGNDMTTKISNINPDLCNDEAGYQKLDTCARAIANVLTNTYRDIVIYKTNRISISDVLD